MKYQSKVKRSKLVIILLKIANIVNNNYSIEATKIIKTNTEILFEPIGQMIPELSWAKIRVKIDISSLYNETIDLCEA